MISLLPEILLLPTALIIICLDLFYEKAKIFLISGILILASIAVSVIFRNEIIYSSNTFIKNSFAQGSALFLFRIAILIGTFFIISFSKNFLKKFKYQAEFIALTIFASIGMMITIAANDLIMLFLGIELTTITFYLLSAIFKNKRRSIEAGLKFFFMGTLSTAFMLFGFSLIFGLTGETNFDAIQGILALQGLNEIIRLSIIFIVIAFAFKIALFPFQMWIPDVYEGAPVTVTAWLAAGSKIAGFMAFLRIISSLFANYFEFLLPILILLSILSLIFGNIVAIPQKNIKRLLAFSSIGQAGFILLGLMTFQQSISAILYYLIAYFISTLLAFLSIITIYNQIQSHKIEDYKGLSKRLPFLSLILTISLLSLLGLPPLPVFWGKFFVLAQAINQGYIWISALALITTVISAYYYLKVIKNIYFEKSLEHLILNQQKVETVLLFALTVLFFALSFFPDQILNLMGF